MRKGSKKSDSVVLDVVEDIMDNINQKSLNHPAIAVISNETKEQLDTPVKIYDESVIYHVGNITINKVSMEQLKRAIREKDITHITSFLEMFIAEAEKNKENYKQEVVKVAVDQVSGSSVKGTHQKIIEYTDNNISKFMRGEIIDIRDEQTPDNHITRTTRLVVEPVNTNIEIPIGSLLTTPDKRFAVIKRNSQTVYESVEYLR